jgi:outer membrane protein insertion porin family/translocation and assembly module TamA
MATTPSSKFVGLFRGVVYDYEIFNQSVLQTDLQRIERYYRARGFYKARVRAGRIFYEDEKHVRVQVEVHEGPPIIVQRVAVLGIRHLPTDVVRAARRAAAAPVAVGKRFEEEEFVRAEADLKRALTDRGYAHVTVKRVAEVDLPRDRASVAFYVEPHEPARFGEVRIEGLGKLPEAPVRRALDIEPGDAYSTSALESAQQALLELGVFSSVQIEPVLEGGPEQRTVPLRVRVEPSPLRSVQLGGGVTADAIRTDVHLRAGWEHRNFFGGLRRFNVELRPALVFYPTRIGDFRAPTDFLPEVRVRSELRQPGFIEARTNGLIRGEFNAYPVLLGEDVNEDWPIIGYLETRGAVGVDRTFGRLYAALLHNVQRNVPFVYKGELHEDLGPVLVSYPQLLTILDFRDDRVQPHKGAYISNDLQVAGVGGDARDIKVQPDVRGYVPVAKGWTVALRASVGFLFPQNWGDTLQNNAENNVLEEGSSQDVQISFLRGFFSGGPTTNRGYAVRGVGPHGIVPFYNPGLGSAQNTARCNPASVGYEEGECELPLGGLTLWEASLELRYPISGPLSGATFCDTSDVSPKQTDIRLNRPHLSCGLGFRYDTPVGPIRLDAGYRIPGMQVFGDDAGEGVPNELFGVPMAIAFGIGEAY